VDINFAAWMISGGRPAIDPSEAHDQIHRRALAEARAAARDFTATPGRISRLAAATRATFRPAAAPVDPACCPA
jgi:hypothetical protein